METDGFPVVVDGPAVDACRPEGVDGCSASGRVHGVFSNKAMPLSP